LRISRKAYNHELAPICAAWVKEMRELFGDVKVLYVKEGDFEMELRKTGEEMRREGKK
jgi:hypothetical protein